MVFRFPVVYNLDRYWTRRIYHALQKADRKIMLLLRLLHKTERGTSSLHQARRCWSIRKMPQICLWPVQTHSQKNEGVGFFQIWWRGLLPVIEKSFSQKKCHFLIDKCPCSRYNTGNTVIWTSSRIPFLFREVSVGARHEEAPVKITMEWLSRNRNKSNDRRVLP